MGNGKISFFAARWFEEERKVEEPTATRKRQQQAAAKEKKNKSHSSPYLSSFFSPKALRRTTAGVVRPCSRLCGCTRGERARRERERGRMVDSTSSSSKASFAVVSSIFFFRKSVFELNYGGKNYLLFFYTANSSLRRPPKPRLVPQQRARDLLPYLEQHPEEHDPGPDQKEKPSWHRQLVQNGIRELSRHPTHEQKPVAVAQRQRRRGTLRPWERRNAGGRAAGPSRRRRR